MSPLAGHYWTLAPHLRDNLRRPHAPARAFGLSVRDARFGSVRLTGLLDEHPEDLGLPGSRGLEGQVLGWLTEQQ